MSDTESREISQDGIRGPMRGRLIGSVAVVVIGIAVVLFGLASRSNVAESDTRAVHINFDGDQCSVTGPLTMSEGELEITYENLSQERVWAQVAVLDEGYDGRDLIAGLIEPSGIGPPGWAHGVWSQTSLDSGETTLPDTVEVKQGFHVVVCGTWTPEYRGYFGSELRVHG